MSSTSFQTDDYVGFNSLLRRVFLELVVGEGSQSLDSSGSTPRWSRRGPGRGVSVLRLGPGPGTRDLFTLRKWNLLTPLFPILSYPDSGHSKPLGCVSFRRERGDPRRW